MGMLGEKEGRRLGGIEELELVHDEIVRWLPRAGNSELDTIFEFVEKRLKILRGNSKR